MVLGVSGVVYEYEFCCACDVLLEAGDAVVDVLLFAVCPDNDLHSVVLSGPAGKPAVLRDPESLRPGHYIIVVDDELTVCIAEYDIAFEPSAADLVYGFVCH